MRPQDVRKAREVPGLSPAERLVLETLTDYASYERGVFIPQGDLAQKTGLHFRTIRNAARRLISLGYVDEMKRARTGQVRTLMPRPERFPSLLTPEVEASPRHDAEPPPDDTEPRADESSALDSLGW